MPVKELFTVSEYPPHYFKYRSNRLRKLSCLLGKLNLTTLKYDASLLASKHIFPKKKKKKKNREIPNPDLNTQATVRIVYVVECGVGSLRGRSLTQSEIRSI